MKHGQPIFGYRNNLKGATFRAGSQVQAAPASHLATDIGAEPWQTAGVRTAENGAWVEIDAGKEVPWRAFLLARTNLTSEATARFMLGAPTNVMVLDGTNGTYASTPNNEAVNITGDMTLVVRIAPDAWATGSNQEVISKWGSGGLQYLLRINSSGGIFVARDSASGERNQGPVSFPNAPNDRPVWIAVTMVYHDSGITFNFYTSDYGSNWSLLNSLERGNVGPGISLPDTGVAVGSNNNGGSTFSGKIYRAQIYSGAGFDLSSGPTGTLVADFNPGDTSPGSTEFTSATTGETWTLHGNAAIEREFLPTYDSGPLGGLVPGYQQLVHIAPEDIMARHLRIDVDDPDNPDGFIRIGLAFGGPVFQPQHGIEHGANFGVAGLRQDITTRGGQTYPVALYQQRQWQVSFPALTEEEVYAEGLEIQRCAEMGGNVLFVPRPGNGLEQQEAVFGMLQSRATFGFPHYGLRSWAFTIAERL